MKVSVIIPSRLQHRGNGVSGDLWLDRALQAVDAQTLRQWLEWEVVVGLDPGVSLPERLAAVRAVNGRVASQACAVNAAVAASNGDVLAFLEDDDSWRPRRLEYGLALLERYDVVTSNQTVVAEDGAFVSIFDFPTPSGWLLRRELWDRLGPLDETFRFHVDTEYLGRMIARRVRRIHLVEANAPARTDLGYVGQYSAVGRTAEPDPLVVRTVNLGGSMAQIASRDEARQQSHLEHHRMMGKYGLIPW